MFAYLSIDFSLHVRCTGDNRTLSINITSPSQQTFSVSMILGHSWPASARYHANTECYLGYFKSVNVKVSDKLKLKFNPAYFTTVKA